MRLTNHRLPAKAFFLCLLILPMVGTSIPAQAMSESRIKDQLVGKTVTFYHNNKDKEIIRFFDPNGTLLQTDEDDNFRRGHWAIDDGKLCFAFEGDSAKCRKFIKKKGKYGARIDSTSSGLAL